MRFFRWETSLGKFQAALPTFPRVIQDMLDMSSSNLCWLFLLLLSVCLCDESILFLQTLKNGKTARSYLRNANHCSHCVLLQFNESVRCNKKSMGNLKIPAISMFIIPLASPSHCNGNDHLAMLLSIREANTWRHTSSTTLIFSKEGTCLFRITICISWWYCDPIRGNISPTWNSKCLKNSDDVEVAI